MTYRIEKKPEASLAITRIRHPPPFVHNSTRTSIRFGAKRKQGKDPRCLRYRLPKNRVVVDASTTSPGRNLLGPDLNFLRLNVVHHVGGPEGDEQEGSTGRRRG